MATLQNPNQALWTGRTSQEKLYLHEKVVLEAVQDIALSSKKTLALVGYACDAGVTRNMGRIGSQEGPDAIRSQLGKLPNHLSEDVQLLDVGTIACRDGNMEAAQTLLSNIVYKLAENAIFPLILGGGHDMAYGTYTGLRSYLPKDKTLGIINFDAHLDLRPNTNGNNSGTPFYQIASDCQKNGDPFKYFCLGVRKDANSRQLYEMAHHFGAFYLEREFFNMHYLEHVQLRLMQFLEDLDFVYATIDMDGFSSAYAPGVSAASPMGFSPDVVLECLKLIVDSKKLVGLDIAEYNPTFDVDNQTAKLAASLAHYVVHAY